MNPKRLRSLCILAAGAALLAVVAMVFLSTTTIAAQEDGYTLTISAGDSQRAWAGTDFAGPLQVTVMDSSGMGVAGVAVTFAAPTDGATTFMTAPHRPYATTLTVTTDANGAASVNPTASCTPGNYQVTASSGGEPVSFNLTNTGTSDPHCRNSNWMEDPLNPRLPAPAADTPIDTSVAGYWWRDTSNQNALSQHSAREYTDQVILVSQTLTGGVWVYSSPFGQNVTLIMGLHKYLIVGCGGGESEALSVRNKFLTSVPGFAVRTNEGAILLNSRPEDYWGCRKWNPRNIYASDQFENAITQYQQLQTESDRRMTWTYGRNLAWGPDGMLGAGIMKQYNPTAPASRPPTVAVSGRYELRPEGDEGYHIQLIHSPTSSDDNLIVHIMGSWNILIAADPTAGFLSDQASLIYQNRPVTQWIAAQDLIRQIQPAALVQMYGLPVVGASAVDDLVLAQRDALQYLYDQTLTRINQGDSIDEIAAAVSLPENLASHPANQEFAANVYGIVRKIYRDYRGWFGGETDELASSLTPVVKAQALADLAGGIDDLIAAARQAELDARDQAGAEKALYLAHAAYELAPEDFSAKQVYAQTLRKNAFMQKSAATRNYFLSEAQSLGAETIVTNLVKTGDEDAPLAFRAVEFTAHTFGISGASLETVKIASLPPAEHGALALAGVSVAAGQEIPVGELDGLTFTPTGDWNGETSFLWNGAAGGTYAVEDASVTITITALNDAPVIRSPLSDVSVDEDAASQTFNLAEVFTDIDGDPLSYQVENSSPALVSAAVDGAILTLNFQAEQNGAATITVSAADLEGAEAAAWAVDDFAVTVNPVNDAPWANNQAELVTAGLARTFTLEYGDVETAQANLVVTFSGPSHGTLNTSALPNVTYLAPAGYIGPDSFTFTVADRGDPDGCTAPPCTGALQAQATVSLDVAENSIRGQVYNDANANGSPDVGESGVAGVTVRLTPLDGSPDVELVTGQDGAYAFGSLLPGSYRVRQALPPGYVQTTPDPADITLVMGQAAGGIDFGVVYSADLSITMTADVNDKKIIYTFVVTNAGPAGALEATLINLRPHGVSYTSVITTQGACQGGNTLTCEFGALSAGASVTVTISANRTDKKNPIENTATVTSSIFDINLANNIVTVTTP